MNISPREYSWPHGDGETGWKYKFVVRVKNWIGLSTSTPTERIQNIWKDMSLKFCFLNQEGTARRERWKHCIQSFHFNFCFVFTLLYPSWIFIFWIVLLYIFIFVFFEILRLIAKNIRKDEWKVKKSIPHLWIKCIYTPG